VCLKKPQSLTYFSNKRVSLVEETVSLSSAYSMSPFSFHVKTEHRRTETAVLAETLYRLKRSMNNLPASLYSENLPSLVLTSQKKGLQTSVEVPKGSSKG
jgi:hypothetical protein